MSTLVPRVSAPLINSITLVAQTSTKDVWNDFLTLQLSPNTKRTYASALNDFFIKLTGIPTNPQQIQEFLRLSQFEAVGVVLKYQGLLLDLGLAPSTINTRLSAVKSLTSHARKLGQCNYSLEDVTLLNDAYCFIYRNFFTESRWHCHSTQAHDRTTPATWR